MAGPPRGGGSRKDKPNRAKVEFRQALQQYCDERNFNPFYAMVQLALDPHVEDQHLRFLALRELCQYLQPKLRAVVIAGDAENPVMVAHDVKVTLRQALELAYGPHPAPNNGQALLPPVPVRR